MGKLAVVFDVDDTLVSTTVAKARASERIARYLQDLYGVRVDAGDFQRARHQVEGSVQYSERRRESIEYVLRVTRIERRAKSPLSRDLLDLFLTESTRQLRVNESAARLLAAVVDGDHLAVSSTNGDAETVRRLDLPLVAAFTATELDSAKPERDHFAQVARRLRCPSVKVFSVGNSVRYDGLPALAAGYAAALIGEWSAGGHSLRFVGEGAAALREVLGEALRRSTSSPSA